MLGDGDGAVDKEGERERKRKLERRNGVVFTGIWFGREVRRRMARW